MVMDGLAAFWWSCTALPDKDSRPVWYTWDWIQERPVVWRRIGETKPGTEQAAAVCAKAAGGAGEEGEE